MEPAPKNQVFEQQLHLDDAIFVRPAIMTMIGQAMLTRWELTTSNAPSRNVKPNRIVRIANIL